MAPRTRINVELFRTLWQTSRWTAEREFHLSLVSTVRPNVPLSKKRKFETLVKANDHKTTKLDVQVYTEKAEIGTMILISGSNHPRVLFMQDTYDSRVSGTYSEEYPRCSWQTLEVRVLRMHKSMILLSTFRRCLIKAFSNLVVALFSSPEHMACKPWSYDAS